MARWLLIWFGGFGFITLAVLVLPFLRIGGLQLFVLDLSVQSAKFVPRMFDLRQTRPRLRRHHRCRRACLPHRGDEHLRCRRPFDGRRRHRRLLSHDASIAYFNSPAIEWTVSALMVVSAMPFVLHLESLRRGPQVLFRDEQVRLFLGIIALAITSLFLWRVVADNAPLLDAAREATFNVTSMISTTGFSSQDFDKWGGPSLLLLVMMLVGGCTGSTAGGIKMFRCACCARRCGAGAPPDLSARHLVITWVSGQPRLMRGRLLHFACSTTFFSFAMALGPSACCSTRASVPRRRRWAASVLASARSSAPAAPSRHRRLR
ncbi:MAG: potassium transporter TrkG [Rhodospirillales bacterium]